MKTEKDPKKQQEIYDEYLKAQYLQKKTTADPLASRSETEKKFMAAMLLQHEGDALTIKAKKISVRR